MNRLSCRSASKPHADSQGDVAQALNVSLKTVRRRLAAGDLPHYRVGRLIRIREDDLAAFLAAQRRSGSEP
ncbi:MAG: helix-turn-helix domain-containing protein [Alphaproteobacteria bacterium]|nr:helix-turn-helix domain-containing protein [Alphaproteobacteria bacterium]